MRAPERIESEVVFQSAVLSVSRHTLTDRAHPVFTLRQSDWVMVPARTDAGRWVFVEQHRHGIDAATLEPAGGVIDDGEVPEAAALRELHEETGFAGGTLTPLGWTHPNPALSPNRCHFFFAEGVHPAGPPPHDPEEPTHLVVMEELDVEAALGTGDWAHALAEIAVRRALEFVRRRP